MGHSVELAGVGMKDEGKKMGFRHVESGPFVRSSYHAHEQADGADGADGATAAIK